jgi:AraC-like DNA-binding protein
MLMPVVEYFFSWRSLAALISFQYLIGPFLYLYIRSFKGSITWRIAWPHFLLFAIVSGIMIFYYYPWISKFPDSDKAPPEILLAPITYALVFARNAQMLAYYFLCRRILGRYQRSIQHLYSETSKINLDWIRWLLNGFLLLIIIVFAIIYFIVTYPENFSLFILISTAVITPYIYVVAIKGMGQPTLWQVEASKNKEKIEEEITEAEKIQTSAKRSKEQLPGKAFSDEKTNEIIGSIILLMEKDKLYQEPELTLQILSDKLAIPAYQVSQTLNEGLKRNFYDLINSYRVEEAKRLLMDSKNKNFTILSVGFEAGFNSKTTFNTVFKKFTGLTPTEYRDKYKMIPIEA